MKQKYLTSLLLIAFALFMVATGVAVLAQMSANYDLSWHVIGNGGGQSSSADFQVKGTIGQSVASPPQSNSADFKVVSGYWVVGANRTVYLPTIIKN